jgi:nicotinamide-nucleotide amidase
MSGKELYTDAMRKRCEELLEFCRDRKFKIATAESCTGGAIATLLTEIPGSSKAFERGFVTYSNESKTEMLGVDKSLIDKHGAVSAEVASAMAKGALKNSHADIAISVTGIAGPDGGTLEKPVGLVYLGVATKNGVKAAEHRFKGNRCDVRLSSIKAALSMLGEALEKL